VNEDDRCEDIFASVGIFCLDIEEDDMSCENYASSMESGLETAILEGQLADALSIVNANSPIYILTGANGVDGSNRDIDPSDEKLSAGAITGLVAVGVVALLMITILLVRRNKNQEYYSKQGEGDLEEITPAAIIPATELEGTDNNNNNKSNLAKSSSTAPSRQKVSSSSKTSKKTGEDMDNDGHESYLKVSGGGKDENSSNAGSSGWSSHGGMSSIDTSSVDDEFFSSASAAPAGGMSLAALGAASHPSVFRNRSLVSEDDDTVDLDQHPDDIAMTYSELDRAISKGDWAAVGKLLQY
jgi:hypothetical protein